MTFREESVTFCEKVEHRVYTYGEIVTGAASSACQSNMARQSVL